MLALLHHAVQTPVSSAHRGAERHLTQLRLRHEQLDPGTWLLGMERREADGTAAPSRARLTAGGGLVCTQNGGARGLCTYVVSAERIPGPRDALREDAVWAQPSAAAPTDHAGR